MLWPSLQLWEQKRVIHSTNIKTCSHVLWFHFTSQHLSCKFKVLQMVKCIQHKTDLSLIYTDVMLYCYRRAGKCSKADAEWTSFFEYNFKQHAVGLKLCKLLKWEHFKLSHAIKLMLIQSITTQVSEYGVVIHVCVIKSLPFDQWRKKIKIIFLRYLEKFTQIINTHKVNG